MTRQETAKFLKLVKSNFPNAFKHLVTSEDHNLVLEMWSVTFKTYSFGACFEALNEYMSKQYDFYPSIGHLQGGLVSILLEKTALPQPKFDDVWIDCMNACDCEYRRAKKKFGKLPENVQRALGHAGRLVEIGWSDEKNLKFVRKEIEKKYEEIMQAEKRDFSLGKISLDDVKRKNSLPYKEKKIEGIEYFGVSMKGVE